MGMGEPLENFEEVMKALDILTAQWGFEMGAKDHPFYLRSDGPDL